MAKLLGFLAAIALSAFCALAVFDVDLHPVPPWAIGLATGLSAAALFLSLATTFAELDAERRERAEAERQLQQWRTADATMKAQDAELKRVAARQANLETVLRQREEKLAAREAMAREAASNNEKEREALKAERETLAKDASALSRRFEELGQAEQAQKAERRELDAIVFERNLLPLRGSFFETPQEVVVAQAYDDRKTPATVRPMLGVDGTRDHPKRFFVPLLGLPEKGAMHVHLCGPLPFREAYRDLAADFVKQAGISLVTTDEDSVDIPGDIRRRLEDMPHSPDSIDKYQACLRTGRMDRGT